MKVINYYLLLVYVSLVGSIWADNTCNINPSNCAMYQTYTDANGNACQKCTTPYGTTFSCCSSPTPAPTPTPTPAPGPQPAYCTCKVSDGLRTKTVYVDTNSAIGCSNAQCRTAAAAQGLSSFSHVQSHDQQNGSYACGATSNPGNSCLNKSN